MTYSCSDIMGKWRFSKDSIKKINQITEKTKIIERGGVFCGKTEKNGNKKIDLISECKGTRCEMSMPSVFCKEQTIGTFHTHPGNILKTRPSIGDLMFHRSSGYLLMCIGGPKAKEDTILCIRQKHLNKNKELELLKKLEDAYKLENKIKNLPFIATKKERKDFEIIFDDIFSNYYKFDPSKCIE